MWTFDIRNTVPDYPSSLDSPEAEVSYEHVNAMCFLLDGVRYRVVYGPVRHLVNSILGELRSNAAAAHGVLGEPLVHALREHFEPLAGLLIPMSKLYTETPAPGSTYDQVLRRFAPWTLRIPPIALVGRFWIFRRGRN